MQQYLQSAETRQSSHTYRMQSSSIKRKTGFIFFAHALIYTVIYVCYTVTLTVKEGTCTKTEIMLVDVFEFTVSDAQTDPECFGYTDGTITLTPTNGTGPYTYTWDQNAQSTTTEPGALTATGLGDGAYEITITDAQGCTDVVTVTLSQPAEPDATFNINVN